MYTDEDIIELFFTDNHIEDNKEPIDKKKENIFTVFNKIVKNQHLDENDYKLLNSFMLLKWLSGNRKLIRLAYELNEQYIPLDVMIEVIKAELKKEKIYFIPWIKKDKSIIDKKIKDMIQKEYNLNDQRLQEVIDIIDKKHIKYLKTKYMEK